MRSSAVNACINLAAVDCNPFAELLSYYASSLKQTKGGRQFYMYAGFYRYMIASGNNPRFLRAKSTEELDVKKRCDWKNLIGLETHLESVLHHNLMSSLMTQQFLKNHCGAIVWEDPTRDLTYAEKRWLRVVQTVVRRVKSEL